MTSGKALLSIALFPAAAFAQSGPIILPPGTQLPVRTVDHLPMKAGEAIRAELLYPVYEENEVVLPAGTIVNGSVVSLSSDHAHRVRARLGADFTPFHIPVVRFTSIVLGDGSSVPITTSAATDGAPVFRAVTPPPAKGGFVHRQIDATFDAARTDLAIYIAPGKADRLKQFLWNRLPYHPERIEKGTAWTTEIAEPVAVLAQAMPVAAPAPARARHFWEVRVPPPPVRTEDGPGRWIIEAFLDQPLSSEFSKAGQTIHAVVAEPVLDGAGAIEIPQGATLIGTVSLARPARRFGRTGGLSFNFSQLTISGGEPQNVQTTLRGADASTGLLLDAEGQVKSKPQDKISLPIILAFLASRPLDQGHDHEGAAGRNAAGGASLGLIGTVIAAAGASPSLAAGIGYYGAALAFYDRWIARGRKIVFPRDTRIVVETVARHSAPIKPTRIEP